MIKSTYQPGDTNLYWDHQTDISISEIRVVFFSTELGEIVTIGANTSATCNLDRLRV